MSDRYLTDAQLEHLGKPLDPKRVKTVDRQRYLASHDVIAMLDYTFGFTGWDQEVTEYGLIFEEKSDRGGWDVAYHARVKLTIVGMCQREDVAAGTASNQRTRGAGHELALTSAASTALKRAARSLGNQFGLSLYDPANTTGIVVRNTLAERDSAKPG